MKKSVVVMLCVLTLLAISCKDEITSTAISYSTPTVKGSVSIPTTAGIAASDLWVKVVDTNGTTRYVGKVGSDGTWVVTGLSGDVQYSVLITSIEPEHGNYSKDVSTGSTNGYGGWLTNVTATTGEANNVGSVKVKPLGTIKGNVTVSGAADNYDTTVYIPGTSYLAMTDAEGNFSISNVPQATYSLRYVHDDYLSQMKDNVILASNDDETSPVANVGAVTLIRNAGTVRGTVQLDGVADSTGINIKLSNTTDTSEGTTSADGSFAIYNVVPGTYNAEFSYPGYLTKTMNGISVVAAQTTALDEATVLTANGGSISGSIDFGDGSGKDGAIVLARSSDGRYSYTATTDTDGRFMFSSVYPETYTLTVSRTGYETKNIEDVTVNAGSDVVLDNLIITSDYGRVVGKVLLNDNGSGDGVSIVAVGQNDSRYYASTGPDGSYAINSMSASIYTITASKAGYAYGTGSVSVEAGKTAVVNEITLANTYGTLKGTVTDRNGTAIPGAQVNIGEVSLFTVEDGTFSGNIAVGSHAVTISKDGYVTVSLGQTITVGSSVTTDIGNISLSSVYGTVKGRIVLPEGVSPVGVLVVLENKDNTYSATAGLDGGYLIKSVIPGKYTLTVSRNNYMTVSLNDVTITEDGICDIGDMDLVPAYGIISGRVLLEGETNYSGVVVSAVLSTDESAVHTAVTLEDGTYYLGGINPGTYSIQIQKGGFITDRSQVVTVFGGESSSASTITLASIMSTVKGNVTLDGSNDHTGITVLLRTPDGSRQYSAATDQGGNFTITNVVPGDYIYYASKAGYETRTVENLTIESSTTKALDSQMLAVGIRSITGSVQLELRTDHAGALVTATSLSDNTLVYSAITNSEGSYTLAGMKPGEYRIIISDTGYRTVTLPTVNVVSDSTASIGTTDLEINRGTVLGKVTLEGRSSNEGVKVELLQGAEVYETQYSDPTGAYAFYVPQGNYSGVRFSKDDFRSEIDQKVIALFADNYVTISDVELVATHNTVSGIADVLTTDDDSSVEISFDGVDSIPAIVTAVDGAFRFDHVPVGDYVLRLRRDNCSDITVPVSVRAADEISLGTVRITPNTGSVTGKVNLEHGSSLSGVRVEVDMGTEKLCTLTDASGRYEIGGVSIADIYTVTYCKEGWVSRTRQIDPVLGKLEVRELDEITLVDTTAPVLEGVVINGGSNTAADRHVTLHITASDSGSGLSKMQINTENDFDRSVTLLDFLPSYEYELPSGNGLKTVYVKVFDAAEVAYMDAYGYDSSLGSDIVSASVTLTDQKKEVRGVLSGEDLHWTEERSPYLVTGNILVEEDKSLVIDPGVDIQFAGAYYMQIEGTLSAIGTEEKRISFYGVGDGKNTWTGIIAPNDVDCRISYADITGMREGLQGYVDIDHSSIRASSGGSAFGKYLDYWNRIYYRGISRNNMVSGGIFAREATFASNIIETVSAEIRYHSWLIGNVFTGSGIELYLVAGENNKFTNMTVRLDASGMAYSAFEGCVLNFINEVDGEGGVFAYDEFRDCSFGSGFNAAKLVKSNVINCGTITVTEERTNIGVFDLTENFWGYDKTKELDNAAEDANITFFNDYYDDFNVSRIDYSGYVSEPYENIGYIGDGYYSSEESSVAYAIGDEGPAGGIIFYDKGYYSDGWRYLEAAPEDIGKFIFGCYKENLSTGTRYAIGSGEYNTRMLVLTMGDSAYTGEKDYEDRVATDSYAARMADNYSHGGCNDWFLPSGDELNLMYTNLHTKGIGGFASSNWRDSMYWSSSEEVYGYACAYDFCYGGERSTWRYECCNVRPIRAF